MPQSELSTPNKEQFVVIDLPDSIIVASGGIEVSNPARSTTSLIPSLRLGGSELPHLTFFAKGSSKSLREIEELWRLRTKATSESKPVSYQTMVNSKEVLKRFSIHFSISPELSAFPNGELGLDWSTEKGSLSILVDDRNIYFYSKTRNGKRRKGSEPWNGTIPQEILDLLEQFLR